jgi:hypothetical protein
VVKIIRVIDKNLLKFDSAKKSVLLQSSHLYTQKASQVGLYVSKWLFEYFSSIRETLLILDSYIKVIEKY